MSYPGTPSLAPDVQHRLLETFEQTLDLAAAGSAQEALLGCDFLLRMDAAFEPARTLMARLNAWDGPGGPDVEDLRSSLRDVGPAPAAPAAAPPPAARPARAPATPSEASFADLRADVEPESAPYVARFVRDARAALERGQRAEAERLLAKARALDETSPEVYRLAREIETPMPAPATPSAEPPGEFVTDPTAFAEIGDLSGPRSIGDLAGPRPFAATPPGWPPGSAPGSGEDPRIAELLAAGQAAFERGEHQNAIDAWSRVFLIDIDHAEASRRVEEARRFKAEAERKVEEMFQDGLTRYEDGDRDGARDILGRLLAANPGHLAAREVMDRLEASGVEAPAAPPRRSPAAETPPSAARAKGRGVLKEEIMVPPEPGQRRPAAAAAPAEKGRAGRKAKGSRGLFLAAAALLVLVAAGAWLWTQRDRLFPNRAPATPAGAVAATDPLERARRLHAEGKTSAAVALLRRLASDDPRSQEAQALIAEWETLERPAAPSVDPAKVERRAQLIAAARQAMEERRFVAAADWLRQAGEITPLDAETAALETQARAAVAPYAAQLGLFRQGEWEAVLPALWRLREADPQNRDVTSMIVDCYFNLGVRELQREAPGEAVEKFREALSLAPEDRELRRTASFAEAYRSGSLDLQYKIFVKYLPFRSGAAV